MSPLGEAQKIRLLPSYFGQDVAPKAEKPDGKPPPAAPKALPATVRSPPKGVAVIEAQKAASTGGSPDIAAQKKRRLVVVEDDDD